MLYFSDNIDNYIKKIVPKLIIGNNYKIIGSFGKAKYVTDVDVSNYIDSNTKNSYKIYNIIKDLPQNILFLNFTSGLDKDFELPWDIKSESEVDNYDYSKAVKFITDLFEKYKIDEKDKVYCLNLLTQKPVDIDKLLLIEDHLYQKSKMKYNKEELLKIDIDQLIKNNDNNILHFIIQYENDIIPIDIALVKNRYSLKKQSFEKGRYLMFLKKEYYFILALMARYFYDNSKELENIRYLLYDSYGYYRQILMNLFYLKQFLRFNIFDKNEYHQFAEKVLNKIKKTEFKNYKDFEKAINDKVELNKDLLTIIEEIEIDVTNFLNDSFKAFAYNYYAMIYPNKKLKYDYLAFDLSLFNKN